MSKYDRLKEVATGACAYSEEDWFKPEQLFLAMEQDDARYVSAASPFAVLALIATCERLEADTDRLTAENELLERKNASQRETIRHYKDQITGGNTHLIMLIAERDQLKTKINAMKRASHV